MIFQTNVHPKACEMHKKITYDASQKNPKLARIKGQSRQ